MYAEGSSCRGRYPAEDEMGAVAAPITHTIVQTGKPMAKAEDKLVLGNRIFLVQGVDEPGSLGVCTIYYVEERADVK